MVPKVNTKAPDFTLKNTEGTSISLNDSSKRPKVLFFFPLAFSDICTTELCAIRDNMKLYNAFNAKVIGISVDSFFALNAFKRSENINFTLLSDFNKEVSARYGVLYDDYFGMQGVAKRSSFVIDREGIIQYIEVLEDSSDLPDFKSIQRLLGSL